LCDEFQNERFVASSSNDGSGWQMSLQHGVHRIEIDWFVNYFGSARDNGAINSRSEQNRCSDDNRYVSCQQVCLEPGYYFVYTNYANA